MWYMKKVKSNILSENEVNALLEAAKEHPLTIEELKEYANLVNFNMNGMDQETAHTGILAETTSMLDHLINYVDEGVESEVHPELMGMDESTLKEWREVLVMAKLGLLLPSENLFESQEAVDLSRLEIFKYKEKLCTKIEGDSLQNMTIEELDGLLLEVKELRLRVDEIEEGDALKDKISKDLIAMEYFIIAEQNLKATGSFHPIDPQED